MESFTKIDNIVEICIALDIAILGIAYPIIVDKISTIGDKYGSLYISNVFESTWPQRKVGKRKFRISLFRLIVYFTLSTFFFQVFQFKPWFKLEDWLAYLNNPNNFMLRGVNFRPLVLIFDFSPYFGWKHWFWILENSADLLVFTASGMLIVSFFIWMNKVALVNGKSTSLLTELTYIYSRLKDDSNLKLYYLKSINELTYYAVEKQEEHLQQTMLRFYYEVFAKIQRRYDKDKPLEYPIDLYEFIYKLNELFVNVKNTKLPGIEHRAVSGQWLLGEGIEIQISEETYRWMWMNLCVISENERLIRLFWANSSQHYEYVLDRIEREYDAERNVINKEQIDNRKNERKRFKELHYALGGLLLYRKQHRAINYIFTFSQSEPPNYPLLPVSMNDVFELFDFFSDNYRDMYQPLDIKYPFPELDNLGNRGMVIYWICSYITLLFIRQYTLVERYVYQKHTDYPNLPENISELYRWQNNISYFKKCLNDIISNKELLKELEFDKTLNNKGFKDEYEEIEDEYKQVKNIKFDIFLEELKRKVLAKIEHKKQSAEILKDKVQAFEAASRETIAKGFGEYANLFNKGRPAEETKDEQGDLIRHITGLRTVFSKSAFTNNGNLHSYSFFAEAVVNDRIKVGISESFYVAKTKSYLLHRDNLKIGLKKIINDTDDVVIVGFNIEYPNQQLLNGFGLNMLFYETRRYEGALFVLRKSELPIIEYKDLEEDRIAEQRLKPLNQDLKTYYSVVDINKSENQKIKQQWPEDRLAGELKVQILISFVWKIIWKRDRSVVQVNIMSPYYEQGIETELNNIEPL